MPAIVPPYGPPDADVLVVGEAPGATEAKRGRPFCGKSGAEQERMVRRNGMTTAGWRMTNVVQEYREGNPDPTDEQINRWAPELVREINGCRPKLILAVGRFATRWFLGDWASMDLCHGIPQRMRVAPGSGAPVVVPVTHPAAGLHDPSARAVIEWDYGQACDVIRQTLAGETVRVAYDEYEGNEQYEDVSGEELCDVLSLLPADPTIAVDTEGTTDDPWSIQVSVSPGVSLVLRCSDPWFEQGIEYLSMLSGTLHDTTWVGHNWMYDLPMCKVLGLDLYAPHVRLVDTMVMAYLLRTEPQSLKALAWRHCGMRMGEYQDLVGDRAADRQLAYLDDVMCGEWTPPEPRVVTNNAGESKLYTPRPIAKQAQKLLVDYWSKPDVDLGDRWKRQDQVQVAEVESRLGGWPTATLDDVPLGEAVWYAARDADATLRLYSALSRRLKEVGVR